MLDFSEVKRVPIPEILARYGIRLRYRGEWASAQCPLPTHRKDDKGKNFTVNLKENYWRCFSESCNQANGGRKGGDGINLVSILENCDMLQASKKIAEWFSLNGNKKAEHIARPAQEATKQPQRAHSEGSSSAIAGKGFIGSLDAWFNQLFGLGPELVEDEFWKARRKAVKDKVYESYQNGKKASRAS